MSKIINKSIGIRCADIYLRFPEIMEDECNDLAEFLEDEHIVYEGATDIFIDQKNKLDKQQEVLDKILKLKRYTSLMEYDEEFVKVKDILELLEEIE